VPAGEPLLVAAQVRGVVGDDLLTQRLEPELLVRVYRGVEPVHRDNRALDLVVVPPEPDMRVLGRGEVLLVVGSLQLQIGREIGVVDVIDDDDDVQVILVSPWR
jgi:hypothetical protein